MTTVFLRNAAAVTVPIEYQNGLVLDVFQETSQSTITHNFANLTGFIGPLSQVGIDLLLLTAALYAADKRTLRSKTSDHWTRNFTISMPVADPVRWAAASPVLAAALSFLTGDQWEFSWRQERNLIWNVRQREPTTCDAVCLFSGGLDSLVGAIDLLEEGRYPRLLLVGHYDSTLTTQPQKILADALVAHYGQERVHLHQTLVRPSGKGQHQEYPLPTGREITTRSRSTIFLGIGLAAASVFGPNVPLYVPENGFIALNVPLVNARLGSCSTRTTHPHFLHKFQETLRMIGVNNPILNPYSTRTKGEMLQQCRNSALLAQLAGTSVSCAHPEQGRWAGLPYGNCGYCFPCLIRRASLNAVGLDDPNEAGGRYRYDICTDASLYDPKSNRDRDARAVFTALQAVADPVRKGRLAPLLSGPVTAGSLRDMGHVYQKGLAELQDLFTTKTLGDVRRIAGL